MQFVLGAILLCLSVVYGQTKVELLLNMDLYPSTGYSDCWGYTAPDGREYALLGVKDGTSIVDITDTDEPVEVAFIETSYSTWKDIKTYQHYAYVVTMASSGDGLQIIDLSNLPESAELVNVYEPVNVCHNIYVDEKESIIYTEGEGQEEVFVLSLADPVNPVQLSYFGIGCHDIYVQDGIAVVSEGMNLSFGFWDVSQPHNPTFLERLFPPVGGFAHNAWFNEDMTLLVTTEETNFRSVKFWDVQDLGNIELLDEYFGPTFPTHNAHIKGDYCYISHYASGLRIIDITNPTNVFETAYYDTHNAWGAFPFFRSGKVLISDTKEGLYVFNFAPAKEVTVTGELVAQRDPNIVPAYGGRMRHTMKLYNMTAEREPIDIWTELTYPDETVEGPLMRLTNLVVDPDVVIEKSRYIEIPDEYPSGTYAYSLMVGQYPHFVMHRSDLKFLKQDEDDFAPLGQGESLSETAHHLLPNSPNPFNPSTVIGLELHSKTAVDLSIFDVSGRLVRQIVSNQQLDAGYHSFTWDGRNQLGAPVASGVYIYRMNANGTVESRQMLLTR